MTGMNVAIALHVLGVMWWIGGLAFVTFVFLPLARAGRLGDIQPAFQSIEGRFAPQVKLSLLLVGLSGLYMLWARNGWSWFAEPHFWWLTAMVLYWCWFALMLFVLGPSGMLKKMMKGTGGDAARAWKRLHIIHGVLLAIGLVIIFGAVSGNPYL